MPPDTLSLHSGLDDRWATVRNLLVVRLDNLGDVVLLSPSLQALRENLPESRITLMASPAGSQAAPLLPWVDDLLVWRAVWQDVGNRMPLDPARELELVEALRARSFDAAVIFTSFSQSPHGPAYACYLAGIPLRLGESKEFGGSLLTTELRSLPDDLHQAERGLRLIEAVGFEVRDRHARIEVPRNSRQSVRALLARRDIPDDRRVLLVHPGASCQARRYPPDRFGRVAGLLQRATGLPVLLAGSAREASALEQLAAAEGPGVMSVAGETSVEELAALVERSALVVCNDSIPMHLAAALEVPCVVLYSGTDLESQWAAPWARARILRRETPCSPCYRFECPYRLECLDFISEQVADAALKMLGESAEPALSGKRGAP